MLAYLGMRGCLCWEGCLRSRVLLVVLVSVVVRLLVIVLGVRCLRGWRGSFLARGLFVLRLELPGVVDLRSRLMCCRALAVMLYVLDRVLVRLVLWPKGWTS